MNRAQEDVKMTKMSCPKINLSEGTKNSRFHTDRLARVEVDGLTETKAKIPAQSV